MNDERAAPPPQPLLGCRVPGYRHPPLVSRERALRRRDTLRKTWMPNTKGKLKAMEERHGLMVRFVIGYSNLAKPDKLDMELDAEARQYGDIIRVQHQDTYNTLSTKTMLFFAHFR